MHALELVFIVLQMFTIAFQPDSYEMGDLVIYDSKLCILQDVHNTHLVFRSFNIVDIDSGTVWPNIN